MGLQNKLEFAVSFLIKRKVDKVRVYLHPPSDNTLHQHCVVISVFIEATEVRGSSSGSNLLITFLKAVSELGENIICNELNLSCRSGIAGGLFESSCIERVKSELIERDAFLYHYRNRVPFKNIKAISFFGKKFSSFSLDAADSGYEVSFIMNSEYTSTKNGCLVFGIGCDRSRETSFDKAFTELSSMFLNHAKFPEFCTKSPSDLASSTCKADFHHFQSKTDENKLIFQSLCLAPRVPSSRASINDSSWIFETLESPLRFFKYVKATHPDLKKIEFGFPENTLANEKTYYHPFW